MNEGKSTVVTMSFSTMGFILTVVFLILKVTGVINWNWFWIWFPLWIIPAVLMATIVIAAVLALVAAIIIRIFDN